MVLRRRLWTLLAFLPVAIVAFGSGMFIRNHFYYRGPYLHDSGWFSATVYRAGLIPENPASLRGPITYYWGWHPSVIVSLGSVLSYLAPVDRVDWYSLFQGAIYAPLGLAMPMLVPRHARQSVPNAVLVLVASLAFALSGQVLCCLGYPHFEIFASAGLAIMLAGLATGRERAAWAGIVMALATREDGGIHATMMLGAALALDLTGRPFPVARRRLIVMAIVASGVAVLTSFAQKRLFATVDAWHQYLVGDPPYAHLTRELLARRLDFFLSHCGFVWLPMVVTAVLAAARRDARYLLGWLASLPWLVFNFTAFQELKGELSVYTGFPFVGALFWPAAYARSEAARASRSSSTWPLVAGMVVSLASTIGLVPHGWDSMRFLAEDMFVPSARNPAGTRAFAQRLRNRELGAVYMAPSAAAWALEGLRESELVAPVFTFKHTDISLAAGYAFHLTDDAYEGLMGTGLTRCGRVPETTFYYCTKPTTPLPEGLVASNPFLEGLRLLEGRPVHRENGAIVVEAGLPTDIRTFGPFLRTAPGAYIATWELDFAGCAADAPAPVMKVDIVRGDEIMNVLEVPAALPILELPFVVTPQEHAPAIELRLFSGSCRYTLRGLAIRRREP